MRHSERGSLWRRWDLHFHTPSSFDYDFKSATSEDLVRTLLDAGIEVVAVTDHHRIDVQRIREMRTVAGDRLTILPGIELRDDHGDDPIHYICIFSEEANLDHLWTTLQGRLGLTPEDVATKGGDQRIYVPIERAAATVRELGGVVSIHAGTKSNSIENISNKEQFQQRIKFDITKEHVDLMEIGQIRDIDRHYRIIFPATKLERPLIICSDNHDIRDYSWKAPLWLKADPSFRGLRMVLKEPRDRVHIGDCPPDVLRVTHDPTKYVRSISFRRIDGVTGSRDWFDGTVEFNSGLVAVVGNKGSGKSALADTLGLLGGTRNDDGFSFLHGEKFRHPSLGLAHHFEATLTWESGHSITKNLNDHVDRAELERIKYLPQEHVERICNSLANSRDNSFELELKEVIFSHVPDEQRLGIATLDNLVEFRTQEKQKRIDGLMAQLKALSRARGEAEGLSDPTVRHELEERIKRRELELEVHGKTKPPAIPDPNASGGAPPQNLEILSNLEAVESEKKALEETINKAQEAIRNQERRHAVATRLLEQLGNIEKEVQSRIDELRADAAELGFGPEGLVTVAVNRVLPTKARDEARNAIDALKVSLDGPAPSGLRFKHKEISARLAELRLKLDEPQRQYRAYLDAMKSWTKKRAEIVGNQAVRESLVGLKLALTELDHLPDKIAALVAKQTELAMQIFDQKRQQTDVLRALYEPVQTFIDSHSIARDRLRLEFRAELACDRFGERFLSLIAQNRRGSFIGVDDGRGRVQELVRATDWQSDVAVRHFLEQIDKALHLDQREGQGQSVLLKDQLAKGHRQEEVFDLLYGLEYLSPRYVLRWDGRDLSMLSPGERGTLLLVFYLLIDKSDVPLVIDQPEENLDNHTVAQVLVDCIKEARRRRQVFIVTHNPNLAVVCDADQVVHATMNKAMGNRVTYEAGALENPATCKYVTDVLEGTRRAFGIRGSKYSIGE